MSAGPGSRRAVPPFGGPGRFWRGNLHTHSDRSDGALPLGFAPPGPGETGPALARRARAAGAFIGLAHPAASLLTLADAESVNAAHAVEVYNALAAREERADSWHLCDLLLGRGRRLSGYAADDAHFQPQDPPGVAAWVQVCAGPLDDAALLAALKAG